MVDYIQQGDCLELMKNILKYLNNELKMLKKQRRIKQF